MLSGVTRPSSSGTRTGVGSRGRGSLSDRLFGLCIGTVIYISYHALLYSISMGSL